MSPSAERSRTEAAYSPPERIDVCLVSHRSYYEKQGRGIVDALGRRFDLTCRFVEDGWPTDVRDLADYQQFAAIIFLIKFRILKDLDPFEWCDYAGARIMFDTDACQNYSPIVSRAYLGLWPPVFRAHGFHVLVTTGGIVRDRLIEDGVHAYWIPKAFDATTFSDLGNPRDPGSICYYGQRYAARVSMLKRLDRERLPHETFQCSHWELNERLNHFAGALICNMEIRGARRVPMRLLTRLPVQLTHEIEGLEPMIKNFEVPAAGCAPICDTLRDLDALGFEDGASMVSYSNFNELVEKVRYFQSHNDELRDIGRRAATFVHANHTWDHRARQFEELIVSGAYLPE